MKFINFNQTAINCISVEQWRDFATTEHYLSKRNEELEDSATKELHLVCLSYDDGVRRKSISIAPHMAGRSKLVVEEDKIGCKCAEIQYSQSEEGWILSILMDVRFRTLEDATSAALLCKGKKTYLEKLQTIAKHFPEFKDDIAEDIELIEAIKNGTPNFGV